MTPDPIALTDTELLTLISVRDLQQPAGSLDETVSRGETTVEKTHDHAYSGAPSPAHVEPCDSGKRSGHRGVSGSRIYLIVRGADRSPDESPAVGTCNSQTSSSHGIEQRSDPVSVRFVRILDPFSRD